MNVPDQLTNSLVKCQVVKSYESILDGENVRLVMFRQGQRYGVVTQFPNVAVACDYKNVESTGELRTLIGNEDSIIDWVPISLANERYVFQLMRLLNQNGNFTHQGGDKPFLRVVHPCERS